MTYVVRTAGDPAASLPAIREAVWAVDPLQSFYSVATVEQLLSDTLAARRFTTGLLAAFALAALTLAGLGVYGVIAVATAGRTREFGLRLALGARPGAVVTMVVRDALGLAALTAARPAGACRGGAVAQAAHVAGRGRLPAVRPVREHPPAADYRRSGLHVPLLDGRGLQRGG